MDKYKLGQLLNARQEDLQFEFGVYLQLAQLEGYGKDREKLVEKMEKELVDKLGVDLEEVEEEEENLQDAMKAAFADIDTQLKVYLTMDRNLQQLKNVGAAEDELEGYKNFQKRLEKIVFERYNVTEEDLEEKEDE